MDYQNKIFKYVDSVNRTTGTPTNFTISLDNIPDAVDRVAVMALSIPKIYYGEAGSFILTEGSTQVTITVPAGNYDIGQYRTTIAGLLNAFSPTHYIYSLDFNTILGKFVFKVNNTYDYIAITTTNTLYGSLGFDANTTSSFINGFLSSTNVVNVNLNANLFLKSDICSNPGDQILQEIYTTQNKANQFITWYNQDPVAYSKQYVRGKTSFQFWLTDSKNSIIDLNGGNITFTLVLFQNSPLQDKLTKYLNGMAISAIVSNPTAGTASTSVSSTTTQPTLTK